MIVLVGCVKQKQSVPAGVPRWQGRWPAKDLYISPLFRARRRWAEARGGRWFILSAFHGLLEPDKEVISYDRTMAELGGKADRRAWAERIAAMLAADAGPLAGARSEIHAGRDYHEHLAPLLRRRGAEVIIPTEGMSLGQQLRFYANLGRYSMAEASEVTTPTARQLMAAVTTGGDRPRAGTVRELAACPTCGAALGEPCRRPPSLGRRPGQVPANHGLRERQARHLIRGAGR